MKTRSKLAKILLQVPKKYQKQFILLLKGKDITEKFKVAFDNNPKLQELLDQALIIQDKWFKKLIQLIQNT